MERMRKIFRRLATQARDLVRRFYETSPAGGMEAGLQRKRMSAQLLWDRPAPPVMYLRGR